MPAVTPKRDAVREEKFDKVCIMSANIEIDIDGGCNAFELCITDSDTMGLI